MPILNSMEHSFDTKGPHSLSHSPVYSQYQPSLNFLADLRRKDSQMNKTASSKGVAWSEAEHLAFLQGLKAFGRGQWKQISRLYVPSRTPTQVASHAQKHFLRVAGASKRRSRFATLEEPRAVASLAARPLPPQDTPRSPTVSEGPQAASSTSIPPATALSGFSTAALPFCAGLRLSMPPPLPDANGMALGIPALQPQPLVQAPTSNTRIPMLKVLPGRLDVTKPATYAGNGAYNNSSAAAVRGTAESKPRSPAPRQGLRRRAAAPSKRAAAAAQAAADEDEDEAMDEEELLVERMQQQRFARRAKLSHHSHGCGGFPNGESHSASVCSDETSAAHSMLDALAGIAAALADSADSPL